MSTRQQEMLDNTGREVHVAVDDRSQVVEMWRKNGIICLQCDEGRF